MENSNPFFSIIVPVYRVEEYLRICIESILIQTFLDYELILVDDGSPDACPSICEEYAKEYARVHVIHQNNSGLSIARNKGIKSANGTFLIFVDSDDYWDDPEALEKIFFAIEKNDVDMVIWKAKILNENNGRLHENTYDFSNKEKLPTDEMLRYLMSISHMTMSAWSRTVKRSIVVENDLYFAEHTVTEDIEWSTKVFGHVKQISLLDSAHYIYRIGRTGSITTTVSVEYMNKYLDVINTCLKHILSGDEKLKDIFENYFAYQFVLLCAQAYRYRRTSDYQEILFKIKEIDKIGLMSHRDHPRVKKAGYVYDFLGYRGLVLVFGKFLEIKKML